MNNRKFVASVVLTIMDVIVFVLCVDKGLTPVGIVGACYIALRLFSKDTQDAANLLGTFSESVFDGCSKLVNKFKESRKETPENDIDG